MAEQSSGDDEADDARKRANERFANYPLLSDYMPLRLKNGYEINGFVCDCQKCAKSVSGDVLRGEIREVVEDSYRVTAIGWCRSCNLLTPYLCHVSPEGEGSKIVRLAYREWLEQSESKVLEFRPLRKRSAKTGESVG